MTANQDKTFSGWACTDCLFLLANGETPADLDEAGTAEYLARVEHHCEGTEVTLGMFREDHDCRANFTVAYAPARYSRRLLTVEVLAGDIADARDVAYRQLPPGGRVVGYPRRHDLETRDDCECEQVTFTWSACDVCGSNLGGSRDAVVFWLQDEPASDRSEIPASAPVPEPEPEPEPRSVPDNWSAISSGFGYNPYR